MASPRSSRGRHLPGPRLLILSSLLLLAAWSALVGWWPLELAPRPTVTAPPARAGRGQAPPPSTSDGDSPLAPLPASGPRPPTSEEEASERLPLEGTVVDEEGRPVAGAWLTLFDAAQPRKRSSYVGATRSTEDGTFTLDSPRPGPHVVELSHPDFLFTHRPVTLPEQAARLVMESGASVEVEVLDASGGPVAGSEVHLHDGYRAVPGRTDASGRVTLRPIGPGRHAVVAATPEAEPLRTVRGEVEVRHGGRSSLHLRFPPGASLSGVVVDTAGQPVAEAEVRAALPSLVEGLWENRELRPHASRLYREWRSGTPRPCLTGPDGRFTLTHLTPGAWVVTALKDGLALDERATPGPLRSIDSRPGVLAETGAAQMRLVLALQPFIRGRVRRTNGAPVTRFELEGQLHEDAQGAFRIPIHRGEEKVLVFSAPGLASTVRRLQVREGVGVELGEVVLGPGREVRLRVVDAQDSRPLVGALVDVREPLDAEAPMDRSLLYPDRPGPLELSRTFRTGPDGTVTLPHVEELPRVVLVLDPDYLLRTVPLGPRQRELTIPLERGARLLGTFSVGGKLVGDGAVEVLTEAGQHVATEFVREGSFSTKPLKAGRYLVRVDLLHFGEDALVRPSFPSQVVDVPANRLVPVHFELPGEGAALTVGAPEKVDRYLLVPGAWPLPTTPERFLAMRNGARECLYNLATKRCGFELLPAGRYTLLAVRDSRARPLELHAQEVAVPEAGTLTLELQPRWQRGPDLAAE